MRRHLRPILLACCLTAAAAPLHAAGAWQRQIQFAKKLALRQYYDLSERVLQRVYKDPDLVGILKANAIREIGDYYTWSAPQVARSAAGLQGFIDALHEANKYYKEYVGLKAPKREDKFAIRLQLSRNALATAEVHVQIFNDPDTAKGEKEKHKKQAVSIFKDALKEFKTAISTRKAEVEKKKKAKPKDDDARQKWEEEYNELRTEYFRTELEHLNARVRYAKLLKALKAPAKQWQSELNQAAAAYKELLLDFSGNPAEVQANLYLGVCRMEMGPKHYEKALMRFENVWQKKGMFSDYKRIPCQAAYNKAVIYHKQKKLDEAIEWIDNCMRFASEGIWNMEERPRTVDLIIETLRELEGVDREQFSQRQAAEAFLRQAECFAGKAADKKTKAVQRKKLYAAAFKTASAVAEVRGLMDPKYATLMETWRKRSGLPRPPAAIEAQRVKALQEKNYAEAAKLHTELISAGAVAQEELRDNWFTIAQCYYAAGRHYQAGIVFSALSKWFPEPERKALEAARAAVSAQHARMKKTDSEFDKALLDRYRIAVEELDPLGTAGVTIRKAKDLRKAGKFAQALELLRGIDEKNKAYPNALYEIALTHKKQFEKLPKSQRNSTTGRKALQQMLGAFNKVIDYYKTAVPKLTGEENKEARERTTAVAGASLLMLTDAYLRDYLNQPQKVIELTNDLERTYPGIEATPSIGGIYMKRMHAAYLQINQAKSAKAAEALLPVVEEAWKAAQKFPDFPYIDRAAGIGAHSYLTAANKLDAEAKAAGSADAKKALQDRAEERRHRAIDFYVELLRAAPRQELKVYRYVLHNLKDRGRKGDYEIMADLAKRALGLYGKRASEEQLRQLKTSLGLAHYGLREYREAIPYLQEVETFYEDQFQQRVQAYEKQKEEYERDPGRFRRPPQPPRRNAAQPEVKEKLAYCYLVSGKKDKYQWLLQAYSDLMRIYQKDQAKQWVFRYNLVETYRRLGQQGQVIKLVDRWSLRAPAMGGAASKGRFVRLIGLVLKDLNELEDPAEKQQLLPLAQDLLKRLKAAN
jgi:hypothetical protein